VKFILWFLWWNTGFLWWNHNANLGFCGGTTMPIWVSVVEPPGFLWWNTLYIYLGENPPGDSAPLPGSSETASGLPGLLGGAVPTVQPWMPPDSSLVYGARSC
jgi:hypothetical protein